MAIKKLAHAGRILGVQDGDAVAFESPGLGRSGADHLARIALLKIMEGAVAGNTRDAGNEQGETRT